MVGGVGVVRNMCQEEIRACDMLCVGGRVVGVGASSYGKIVKNGEMRKKEKGRGQSDPPLSCVWGGGGVCPAV